MGFNSGFKGSIVMKYGAMSQAVSTRLLSALYHVAICGVKEVYFHVFLTTTYMGIGDYVTP